MRCNKRLWRSALFVATASVTGPHSRGLRQIEKGRTGAGYGWRYVIEKATFERLQQQQELLGKHCEFLHCICRSVKTARSRVPRSPDLATGAPWSASRSVSFFYDYLVKPH